MNKIKLPLSLLLAFSPSILFSVTDTWTGTTNSNWSIFSNWNSTVPTAGDALVFPSTATNFISNNDLVITPLSMTISSQTSYTIGGSSIGLNGTPINVSLVAVGGAHTISAPLAISGSNTITQNSTGALTISGVISGGGSIVKAGTGNLVLSGSNTYSGGTAINGGTVSISANDNLGNSSGGLSFSAGTLAFSTTVFIPHAVTLNAGGGILQHNAAGTATFNGIFSGTGPLTINGTGGTVQLGSSNTYSGQTNLNGAGIIISSAGALGSSPSLSLASSANVICTATLTLPQTIVLGGNGGIFSPSVGTTTTLSGVVGGTSGSATLAKAEAGTLVLTNTNTYVGGTRIQDGILSVSSDSNLGNSSGGITFNSGAGTLEVTSLSFSSARSVTLDAVSTFQIDGGTSTFSGVFDGTVGSLVKTGAGTLVLSNTNSYLGGTTINAGTIQISSSSNLGSALSTLTLNGGTLQIAASHSASRPVVLNAGGGTFNTNNGTSSTYAGLFSGVGGLTKTGAGTLVLTETNTYTGDTLVTGGTISISADANLGNSSNGLTLDAGTLALSPPFTSARDVTLNAGGGTIQVAGGGSGGSIGTMFGDITGAGILTKTGTGTLILTGSNAYGGTTISAGALQGNSFNISGNVLDNAVLIFDQTSSGTYAPVISGSGTVTKIGSANLTLSGTNTYSGGTTVNAGILSVSTDANLGNSAGALTLNSGTLGITSPFSSSRAVSLNGGGGTIDTNSGTSTFSGNFGGTAGLIKTGGGTLALTGIGSYGGTTISAGTLEANSSSLSGNTVNNAALVFNQTSNGTYAGTISGTGTVTKIGSANLTLSGTNTYSGGTTVNAGILSVSTDANLGNSAGALTLNSGTLGITSPFSSTRAVNLNGGGGTIDTNSGTSTFSGNFGGAAGLTKTGGGTLALTGIGSYGGATISAGTLEANSSSLSGNTVNNAALVFNQTSNGTYAGTISGSGTVTKSGSATLTLSGTNTYSGGTTVNAGTLSVSADANLGNSAGTLTLNSGTLGITSPFSSSRAVSLNGGGGTIDTNSGTSTFSGNFGGTAGLTKTGGGTLALTGIGSYGGTTISAGTLQANSSSLSGNTVNNAALVFNQTSSGTYAGNISGTGTLTKTGTGTLILSGANNYTGLTTVSQGTLQGDTSSLPTAIVNNATLTFNQGADGTFSQTISGSGTFIKTGSGKLILSGNVNQNAFDLQAGILGVNGIATGNMTIEAAGILGGNGTVIGDVTNNGIIAPGLSIGTLTIDGDVVEASGSTLAIEVDPTSSDLLRIQVGGTFTIDSNATLLFIPVGSGISETVTYTLVTATGGVFGTFDNVLPNLPTITSRLDYEPTMIQLVVTSHPFSATVHEGNPGAVAAALDAINTEASQDLINVMSHLRFLPLPNLIDALESMQPSVFKGFQLAQESNSLAVRKVIFQRLVDLSLTSCLKNRAQKYAWDVWAAPLTDFSRQDSIQTQAGYHTSTVGGIVGADWQVHPAVCLGVSGAYTNTDIKWSGSIADGSIQSYYGALYAGFAQNNIFINTSLLGAYSDYSGTRQIDFFLVHRSPKHHNAGGEFSAHLDGGYQFNLWQIQTSPYVSLDYSYLHQGGFTETGAESLNVKVAGTYTNLMWTEIGVNFSHCFALTKRKWIPSVHFGWVKENRFGGANYRCEFVGTDVPFTVVGLYPNRSLFATGVAVTGLMLDDAFGITLMYDGEFGHKYIDQVASLKLDYAF